MLFSRLNVVGNECLVWWANMPVRNNKLRSMKNRGKRWGHRGAVIAHRTRFMEAYVCSSIYLWEWSGWLRKAILRLPQYWHSGLKTHIGRSGSGKKNGNSLNLIKVNRELVKLDISELLNTVTINHLVSQPAFSTAAATLVFMTTVSALDTVSNAILMLQRK